jgi:hypothetical protein
MQKQKKRNQKWFKKQMKKREKQLPTLSLSDSNFSNFKIVYDLQKEMIKLDSRYYLNNETVSQRTDLRYVISTNNIPDEIRTDVKKLLSSKNPKRGQCLWYSKFVSSQIPGVNQIFGLFQKKEFQILSSELPKNQLISTYGTVFYKDEDENVWGLHSWNEYKGVYFDCLKDTFYDFNEEKDFIKYTIVKKDENNIKTELSKFFSSQYEFISSSLG